MRAALSLESVVSYEALRSLVSDSLEDRKSGKSSGKIDIDFESQLATHSAALVGEERPAKLILDRGSNIETNFTREFSECCSGVELRPPHPAVGCEHELVVELLSDRAADLERKTLTEVRH